MTALLDEPFLDLAARALDREAAGIAAALDGFERSGAQHRSVMSDAKCLVAAYSFERSRFHRDPALLPAVARLIAMLARLQGSTGLFDGDNLVSPPDSSFTVNDLCDVLLLADGVGDPDLTFAVAPLVEIAALATPALVTGGVHTPNHRWELACALAKLDLLRPDAAVARRVAAWLAEGTDLQPDGLYSERSPNYAAAVSNPCLISLGTMLDRPELLEVVRANLDATLALIDGDDVETVQSRRQDQLGPGELAPYLMQFRRFALADSRGDFAGVVEHILELGIEYPAKVVTELLLEPALAAPLPRRLALPTVSTRVFTASGLARVQRERWSASVFGGSDVPALGDIRSGVANNPTFLRFRSGAARLTSVRLSRSFFGMGPFRGDGLDVTADGFELSELLETGYYQPLGGADVAADGSYDHGFEGRFAAAMSFARRERDAVRLATRISITIRDDGLDLGVTFDGPRTAFALELAFAGDGIAEGTAQVSDDGRHELRAGRGRYRVGGDAVTFDRGRRAGSDPGCPPSYDPGERYTFLHGTDAAAGTRVYLTGYTTDGLSVRFAAG